MKQFALQPHVQVSDFIQEQCALVREFDASRLCGVRPSESALFVSEELAFQQRTRNRCTIPLYELALFVRRTAVHPWGTHLFARTRASAQRRRPMCMTELFYSLLYNRHRRGPAKYYFIGGHVAGAAH